MRFVQFLFFRHALGHQVEIAEQLQEAQKNLEKAKGEFDIQEKTIIENEKIECKNSPKYHIKKMRLALQGDDCWAGRDKLTCCAR